MQIPCWYSFDIVQYSYVAAWGQKTYPYHQSKWKVTSAILTHRHSKTVAHCDSFTHFFAVSDMHSFLCGQFENIPRLYCTVLLVRVAAGFHSVRICADGEAGVETPPARSVHDVNGVVLIWSFPLYSAFQIPILDPLFTCRMLKARRAHTSPLASLRIINVIFLL